MTQASDKSRAVRWSPTALLILAGALGLLARAWTILHTARQGYAVDDLFDALAWNLVTHNSFSMDGTTPSAHVGPLYPAILAAFYAVVGHRPEWVLYLHIGFDIAASLCIYLVGARLFHPWIGALAAGALFLYPAYWTYDPRIRSERSADVFLSAWLWAMVVCRSQHGCCPSWELGCWPDLTILCKPVTILLAVALVASGLSRHGFR